MNEILCVYWIVLFWDVCGGKRERLKKEVKWILQANRSRKSDVRRAWKSLLNRSQRLQEEGDVEKN